jgi:heme exporter protein D
MGAHAGFIVAAYAVAVVIVTALVLWVVADYRAQRDALAALEARGVARRSRPAGGEDKH